jgi:hypothetical protein
VGALWLSQCEWGVQLWSGLASKTGGTRHAGVATVTCLLCVCIPWPWMEGSPTLVVVVLCRCLSWPDLASVSQAIYVHVHRVASFHRFPL